MAGASNDFKKFLLKGLYYDALAQTPPLTLQAALRAAINGSYNTTPNGMVISAIAGNGQSVQFALPQSSSQYTPFEIAIAVSQLDDLFTDAQSELVTDGIASPNDGQIFARMLELLRPQNEAWSDRSCLQT